MLTLKVQGHTNLLEISQTNRIAFGLASLALGSFLLYATLFSHSELLHNAAHDTRHAITAPCH